MYRNQCLILDEERRRSDSDFLLCVVSLVIVSLSVLVACKVSHTSFVTSQADIFNIMFSLHLSVEVTALIISTVIQNEMKFSDTLTSCELEEGPSSSPQQASGRYRQ